MIRAVLFDFDEVCTTGKGLQPVAKKMGEEFGADPKKILDAMLEEKELWQRGKIGPAEFWALVRKRTGMAASDEELKAFWEIALFSPQVMRLVKRVKEKQLTGLVTDNMAERMKVVSEKHRLREYFNTIIVSGEVGTKKEEMMPFVIACSRLGVEPDECVFVDDKPENVQVARGIGMAGIVFNSANQSVAWLEGELRKAGVEF